jgi:hypothetical protein
MASPIRDPLAVIKVKKIPRHNKLIPAPAYPSMGQPSAADHRFDAAALTAGGRACSLRILGIDAVSRHHEHRLPVRALGFECATARPKASSASASRLRSCRPYARRSKSLVLIPILYLKSVSTGDFAEAVTALLGKDAGARWTMQRSPAASSFEHKDSAA